MIRTGNDDPEPAPVTAGTAVVRVTSGAAVGIDTADIVGAGILPVGTAGA